MLARGVCKSPHRVPVLFAADITPAPAMLTAASVLRESVCAEMVRNTRARPSRWVSTHLWWVHVGMSGYLHLYDVSKSTLTSLTSWDLLVRGCIIFNIVTVSFESLPLSVGDVGVEVSLLVTKSVSSSAPSLRNPVAVSRSLNLACLQSRHCAAGPMFPNTSAPTFSIPSHRLGCPRITSAGTRR